MASFSEKVWAACAKIPRGKVSTYSSIAKAIGRPRACRAVGNALNKNPFLPGFGTRLAKSAGHGRFLRSLRAKTRLPPVPCHRVVKSDGSVGGFARGSKKKVALLKAEGVEVLGSAGKPKVDLHKFLARL